MSFNLVKATDEFLCRKRFSGHRDCHLYPSEASVVTQGPHGPTVLGCCMRQAYFRCMGAEGEPTSVYSQGIFELGKAVEKMLVEDWKKMGIYVAESIRFQNPRYNLSGELDAVIRDPETGELVGVEVKSYYGYNAEKTVEGNRSVRGRPKTQHLLQTLVYAWEFRRQLGYFKIFYKNRGNGEKRSFDVRIVPDTLDDGSIVHWTKLDNEIISAYTVDDIYNRYSLLHEHITNCVPPEPEFEMLYSNERVEREFQDGNISKSKYEKFKKVSKRDGSVKYVERERPGDWQCSYCSYKDLCCE